jgi:hypothetical protein
MILKNVFPAGCATLNTPKYANNYTKVESYMRISSDLYPCGFKSLGFLNHEA